MLLVIAYHLCRRESPALPAVLCALAVFAALGRLSHWA